MKVKIFPHNDGTVDVLVKRTLAKENPSRAVMGVKEVDFESVVDRLIAEMAPPEPVVSIETVSH